MKEMRLRGISDMAAGNAYLPEFMADFNRRFAAAPRSPEDAHRPAHVPAAARASRRFHGEFNRADARSLT